VAKKKPALKVAPDRPNPFDGVIEQLTNERSPQWWVDELEAAAKAILGKYSVEVDVSRDPMKPRIVTKTSAEAPGFTLPNIWPAWLKKRDVEPAEASARTPLIKNHWPKGIKLKDIDQAEAARKLMFDLRDFKRLLADRSDNARDVTVAVAIIVGINAGVMDMRHIVAEAQRYRQKASETREANLQQEVEWFRIEYGAILPDKKFRNETDRFSEINRRLVSAEKSKFSWATFNRRRKDAGFSRPRDE